MEGLLSPRAGRSGGEGGGPTLDTQEVIEILKNPYKGKITISEEDRNTLLEYYNGGNYEQDVNLTKVYRILYPGANMNKGPPYAFGPPSYKYYSSRKHGGGRRSRRNRKTRCRKNSKNNRSRRNRKNSKTNRSRRH
jgi:hypothetical protein